MSDPKDFLTRWSRRKRGAADEPDEAQRERQEPRAPDAPPVERADASPPRVASGATKPAFDLSKLPPIDSIAADTDITTFLAPGVPADVRLAALRRAWVVDPKVRDFVGLNDYDWDFNTPGAIPGFGSLEMTDELRQEVMRLVSAWQEGPEQTTPTVPTVATRSPETSAPPAQPTVMADKKSAIADSAENATVEATDASADHPAAAQDELIGDKASTQRSKDSAASQQKHSRSENLQTLARRGHGRALPK